MLQPNDEEITKMMLEKDIEHEKKKKWYLCTNEIGAKIIMPDLSEERGYDLYETFRFQRESIPPDTIVQVIPLTLLSNLELDLDMLQRLTKEITFREYDPETMMMFTRIINGIVCRCGIWLPDEAQECPHCKKKIRLCSCEYISSRKAGK